MGKLSILLKLSGFVAIFLFPAGLQAQWNYIGPAGISSGWSAYNDIAVDSGGAPIVVYRDIGLQSAPCLRWDGSQWEQIGAASDTFPVGYDLHLFVGKEDRISLLFQDEGNNYLSCIGYNGSQWDYISSQYLSQSIANYVTAAYDTAGQFHVAFVDMNGFHFLRENGANWDVLPMNGLPSPIAYTSLQFGPDNTPYLMFTDMNTLKANCMSWNGAAWVAVGSAGFSTNFAKDDRLLISPTGAIFCAYDDGLTTVKKLNAQTQMWELIGQAGLGGPYIGLEDFIRDSNGGLYISTSQIAGDHARCLKFDGNAWSQLGGVGINDTTAGYPNIALSPDGTLFCTYNDFEISKAVVKEFAGAVKVEEQALGADFELFPNPGKSSLHFSGTPTHGKFSVRILDIRGKVHWMGNLTQQDAVSGIDLTNLDAGLYFVELTSAKGQACLKWIKQ